MSFASIAVTIKCSDLYCDLYSGFLYLTMCMSLLDSIQIYKCIVIFCHKNADNYDLNVSVDSFFNDLVYGSAVRICFKM